MKKNLFSLLFVLGLVLCTTPTILSCSDNNDEQVVNPDVPGGPDEPTLPNPVTPINWEENEVDGGAYGVSIKVTSVSEQNFKFECTPGSMVQSYRMDVYPLCRMYNYLFESKKGEKATEEEVEDLIIKAIYNSEGAGAATFNKTFLGDSYAKAEFDWANTSYSQSEIVPGAEYLIITVGCTDEGGTNAADMKICHLKTPRSQVIGSPRVDIDVNPSYQAVAIQYRPNNDCKYFYQFCGDSEPVNGFIDTYGEQMYIDFMRHYIIAAENAQVSQEDLYYLVNFGYTADPERMITASTIGLDENKTPGEYVRQDFHLLKIPEDATLPKCTLTVNKVGASIVDMNVELEKNCHSLFYRIFSVEEWAPYENADDATMLALARALDQEGWGVKNENFSQDGSFKGTSYQYDLAPNTSYVVAYIGRNKYGQLSEVKTKTFKTKERVTDNPSASKAKIDITVSDPGRTSLKLTYNYEETAVYYHQYIMEPNLLKEENKDKLIEYLLSGDSNIWAGDASGESYTWTGLEPATEYAFAYMAEDWEGVLSEVKIVKGQTEAIQAGPNPTMKLNAYLDGDGNFTVQYSIVKDVAKVYYLMTEDTYSASGDYTYAECVDVWKEYCIERGLTSVNSPILTYDKTKEANRMVALCRPVGVNAAGEEFFGDLYAVWYDKNKGIVTDPSELFPDAPKAKSHIVGAVKPQVVKKEGRIPANQVVNEQVEKKDLPGAVVSGNTIYLDMKKLGIHPHAK